MKINDDRKEDVITIGLDESDVHEAKIDPSQMAWIMNILSSNYKDKYGIVVQEYTSNAWDSHVEAGCTDKSIVIRLVYLDELDNEKPALQIIDRGMGMSPERIKIFGNYGTSTKRKSNDQLGGFGIGSKSGYAYTDSFYVNTTYDSVHYKYLCAKNEKNIPQTNLLNSYEVSEDNYTMITFMIKNNADILAFYDAVVRKTLYFENINYDISDDIIATAKQAGRYNYSKPDTYWNINDNTLYQIENTDFCLLENCPYNEVHLILGQIPYKLDFGLLNKRPLSVPMGIRVDLDVIKPIPTREDIDYTPEAIELINAKIDELAEYLCKKFDEQSEEVYDDFNNYVTALNDYRKSSKLLKLGDITLGLDDPIYFFKLKAKKPVFTELDLISDKLSYSLINGLLVPIKVIKHISSTGYSAQKTDIIFDYNLYQNYRFLKIDKGFNKSKRIVNEYLYSEQSNRVFLIRNKINEYDLKRYIRVLSLKFYPKDQWRKIINQYQKFINNLYDQFDAYEDIEPSQAFVDDYNFRRKLARQRNASDKPIKKENDLITYTCRRADRGDGYVWDKVYQPYSKLFKKKQFVIYAKTKYKDDIIPFVENFEFYGKNLVFMTVNQGKYDLLSMYSNFIKFKDFMSEKNKPFIRGITCYVIHQMFNKYEEIFVNNLNYIKLLSTEVYDDIQELQAYLDKYSSLHYYSKAAYLTNNKFMDACVLECPKLDYSISDVISRVDNYAEVLDNLKYLRRRVEKGRYGGSESLTKDIDVETLKLAEIIIKKVPGNHKFRLNLHHYQKGGADRLIKKYYDLIEGGLDHLQTINKITNYVEEKKEI